MILANTIISLLICLATALDLVLFTHVQAANAFRRSGLVCGAFIALAYMANIFAMHALAYTTVQPTELIINLAVLAYQGRRSWLLLLMSLGELEQLPIGLRETSRGSFSPSAKGLPRQ